MTIEFEDAPEDAVTDGDLDENDIDWDQVVALQGAYDAVLSINDPAHRLEAAKQLVAELNG